jgi:hypothetical protein
MGKTMYRAFNLTCNLDDYPNDKAVAANEANKSIVKKALQHFIKNEKIDGTEMRNYWFPEIRSDIFLSHSHKNEPHAIKLAGFLQTAFGLRTFIDSCVWGHSDDLLKEIDDHCCLIDKTNHTYSYESRNGSTSHVHMMLSTALGMMLDASECVIFLNTPESIESNDSVSKTKSPWIYYELSLMSMLRRQPPSRGPVMESFANKRAALGVEIEYAVSLGDLTYLDRNQLGRWQNAWENRGVSDKHPLDLLYDIAPEN